MKILQLHTGFNLLGGVEAMVINLANEMSKEHDVTVCSVFKPSKDSYFYTRLSSRVNTIDLGVEKAGFSIKNILKVYWYLHNADFDIVHFHGLFYYFALPIILTHNRLKYVYTFHSEASKEHGGVWDRRIIWLKRFCLVHKWMYPVTISKQSQKSFWDYYGCESELIANGIPKPLLTNNRILDEYRLTTKTKVFFHPGRISTPKNQVVLCRVFTRLVEENEDVVLLIAGSNQDHTIFDEMKKYFNKRIVYLGERDDVPQLLSCADGFCLPSIWEGLPVTLLESLSVGCIPICSPVGGIVNVIKDGYNGFLSRTSNEEDYYQIMKKVLQLSPMDCSRIKKNCIDSFSSYNIDVCAQKYVFLYKKLNKKDIS